MKKLSKSAKKQIYNIAFLLLLVAVTLTVLLLSYQELNFGNIFAFIKSSKWWLLILSVVCMVMGIVFEGLSLFIISRSLGHRTRILPSVAYSSADIYYSAITPSATGGQPASAYYMVKDGMSAGTASFTLVMNTVVYTASLVVLTVVSFAIKPQLFSEFEFWPKFFVILGVVIQSALFVLLFFCMTFNKALKKVCNGIITLLTKMRIVKNPEKWRNKVEVEVGKYAECFQQFRKKPFVFFIALIFNVCQRVVRVLISCCICIAADPQAPFWDIFVLQSFVTVGYTSLPMPGGVGVFEYLYVHIYGLIFTDTAFILSSMMVMRTVSYYLSIIVSGAITLAFHTWLLRRKPKEAEEVELPEVECELLTKGESSDGQEQTEDKENEEYV